MRKLKALLTICFVFVLASTIRAQRTSGVNNAELKGDYAFTFSGITSGGGASAVFAAVGRFTADGAGNVTNGEMDTNGVNPSARLAAQTFTASYTIGADHRGVMTLNIPGSGSIAFDMLGNGNARCTEADNAGGLGEVSSGTMEKVDTTAYSTAKIARDYAFGFDGLDSSNDRTAIAGRATANGAGTFTDGVADINQGGRFTGGAYFPAGNYAVTETTTGRGMMTLPGLLGIPPQNLNFVFYVVNAGKLFAMEADPVTLATPLLNGVVLQQQTPLGGFSNSSLNAGVVIGLTGLGTCAGRTGPAPSLLAGLLTADGRGAAALTYDENCGGTPLSVTGLSGTYSVTAIGRAAFNLGGGYVAAYLTNTNQAFVIVPDNTALFGSGEPQAAGLLNNGAVRGAYAGWTTAPETLGVATISGEFTADGVSPTGNISGIEDVGSPSGLSSGVAVNATYSISSTPTNGRGNIQGGIGGSAVVYVVSPSKFVVVSLTDPNPAVLLFEQ